MGKPRPCGTLMDKEEEKRQLDLGDGRGDVRSLPLFILLFILLYIIIIFIFVSYLYIFIFKILYSNKP